jgi:hypothetical protein
MDLNIAQVRSERIIGIGCSASRQQGILRELELTVPFSTSDFAEDGFRLKLPARRGIREEGEFGTFAPFTGEVERDSRNATIR